MLSDYLEQGLINWILRAQSAPTFGASVHVALHTADPTDAGTGTEVSGGNYSRVAVSRAAGSWDAASSRATQNAGAITFPAPNASWGTVTHWAIWDAATTGNLLFHGALSQSKVIGATDPAPSFAIGALDLSFSGAWSTYLANALFDHILRNQSAPSFGASVYISLHTGAPGLTGANEASGGSYARAAVTRATGSFSAPGTGGATDNVSQITFPTPTASWGLITDAGIFDTDTVGNFLWAATMTDKNVNNGDPAPYIAAGELDLTLA